MPEERPTVMISSTGIDLPEHRAAAKDACERCETIPLVMEHMPASDADAIALSLEYVDRAWRYGHVPTGDDLPFAGEMSITEIEFRRAEERGIPILGFVIDEDHPFPGKMVEKGLDAERLTALKADLRSRHVTNNFTTPDNLKAGLLAALPSAVRKLVPPKPASPPAPTPCGAPIVVGLPHENRLFTGRDDLLEALAAAATERTGQATALTALHGMGGVGKS